MYLCRICKGKLLYKGLKRNYRDLLIKNISIKIARIVKKKTVKFI